MIVNRRRKQTITASRMELYATARMTDAVAAQLQMLADDDCVNDAESDDLRVLGQRCRDLAERIFERVETT